MNNSPYYEVISHLHAMIEDPDTSKLFKEKAKQAIKILEQGPDLAIDKALLELEELSSLELSSYYRTQVWDVISLLESLK